MIQLLNIDCMEYMKSLPDKAFDLAIVDPPTGQGEGKNHVRRPKVVRQEATGKKLRLKTNYLVKDWDDAPPAQDYFDELFRVSRHQIILCENSLHFAQKGTSPGRIVWNMLREVNFSDCHIMWTSLIGRIDYFEYMWNGMMQGEAINSRKQIGNKRKNQKRLHPSEKPVKVYKYLLSQYASPGWKILDTHAGSNAIALACHDLGYELTSCERDPDYYRDGLHRYKEHSKQGALGLRA